MNSATQDMKLRQSLLRQYHTKIVMTENSSTDAVLSRQRALCGISLKYLQKYRVTKVAIRQYIYR